MRSFLYRFLRLVWWTLLLGRVLAGQAQQVPSPATVALDSVAVAPPTNAMTGWLLLDLDIQTELDGAVHNFYNFKFDKADK